MPMYLLHFISVLVILVHQIELIKMLPWHLYYFNQVNMNLISSNL